MPKYKRPLHLANIEEVPGWRPTWQRYAGLGGVFDLWPKRSKELLLSVSGEPVVFAARWRFNLIGAGIVQSDEHLTALFAWLDDPRKNDPPTDVPKSKNRSTKKETP